MFSNQWFVTKNFHFRLRSLNIIDTWVNRMKMFNNDCITYFIVSNRWYWWSFFIFLLDAIVLNAFKLWDQFYFDFKLTHSKFQYQITKILLTNKITRKHASNLSILSSQKEKEDKNINKSSSCQWKHADKKSYCRLCRQKKSNLWKRRKLEKISDNFIKKQRTSQIRWQCKKCDFYCKKKDCWRALHNKYW